MPNTATRNQAMASKARFHISPDEGLDSYFRCKRRLSGIQETMGRQADGQIFILTKGEGCSICSSGGNVSGSSSLSQYSFQGKEFLILSSDRKASLKDFKVEKTNYNSTNGCGIYVANGCWAEGWPA